MRRLAVADHPIASIVDEVARTVAAGGIVILPTDTVYGVFCDPASDAAIEKIYATKSRARAKALGLYVRDVASFLALAGDNVAARRLGQAFLPGAITVIVERPQGVAPAVTAGLPSVGLRVADHALLRAILARTGPLAGTSANVSGLPAFAGDAAPGALPGADLFVDDGATSLGTESTVIDVSQPRARVIRPGAIPVAALESILGIDLR